MFISHLVSICDKCKSEYVDISVSSLYPFQLYRIALIYMVLYVRCKIIADITVMVDWALKIKNQLSIYRIIKSHSSSSSHCSLTLPSFPSFEKESCSKYQLPSVRLFSHLFVLHSHYFFPSPTSHSVNRKLSSACGNGDGQR